MAGTTERARLVTRRTFQATVPARRRMLRDEVARVVRRLRRRLMAIRAERTRVARRARLRLRCRLGRVLQLEEPRRVRRRHLALRLRGFWKRGDSTLP